MITQVSISNLIRIDSISNLSKAKIVYTALDGQTQEILLKVAEREWLKRHPNKGIIDKLYYRSNGIHYVCSRQRSLDDPHNRTLTFSMPNGDSIVFYCDETNEVRYVMLIDLLHRNHWGTFDDS